MNRVILNRKDMPKFVSAVTDAALLYAPVMRNNEVSLSEVRPEDEIVFDYTNFALPLKRLFFPQSETIATVESGDLSSVQLPDRDTVIFGARPCDVLSLALLDNVFKDDKYIDPFYCRRRELSVIIAIACGKPLETCFCTSTGGSPAGNEGADILAFDLDDVLMFEPATDKGSGFLKQHAKLFGKPTAAQDKARKEQEEAATKQMSVVDAKDLNKKLETVFDSEEWGSITESCLSCGVCTFSCPTCHCFGLYDDRKCRIRAHDACMFSSFTLEASGHNPRTKKGDRMRQRVMHKFLYTVDNFGKVFCVGCGRCVAKCPVNIDLRETIGMVKAMKD